MRNIHDLLEIAIKRRASDVVFKAGAPPALRVDGKMETLEGAPLTPSDTREFAYSVIYSASRDHMLETGADLLDGDGNELGESEALMERLTQQTEVDIVFTVPRLVRVRANLFLQRGTIGAALRLIPLSAYSLEELKLPPVLKEMAKMPQGLILITGPTGSGKTTTLAALIEEINRTRQCNVFTVEEPIEYIFTDKKSVIHQREVGHDTRSFAAALHSVTRQTPDVIAIGELRDAAAMDVAMTAAEIGHLVITTLHTTSAANTVDRIVNSFPQHLKTQIHAQLAASLLCITSQRLVRKCTPPGRVPAVEVLVNSPTVRKHIEAGETSELYSVMREGKHFGMNTMNQALEKLCVEKVIHPDEAIQSAGNPAELKQLLRHA